MRKFILILFLWAGTLFAGTHTSPSNMFNYDEWAAFNIELLQDEDKIVTINWQGDGGYLSILFRFEEVIQALHINNQLVHFNLVGNSFSAQASSVCLADSIVWNGYFIMFHAPIFLNDSSRRLAIKEIEGVYKINQQCIDKGILTLDLMQQSLIDKEVYVGSPRPGVYRFIMKEDNRI